MTTFQITSAFTKTTYQIDVYIPDTKEPEEGFPIIYVLDGQSYFPFIRDIIRLQHQNQVKTGIQPAIVVGVCHQGEQMREQRFIDFTAPAKKRIIPEHGKGKLPEGYGGAELFYEFIEKELKPAIDERYKVNQERQLLFGHSLGGYFSLWCLFNNPLSFNAYLAISPSVWWNGEEIFHMAQTYLLEGANVSRNRVFLAVGEQEGHMVDGAKRMDCLLRENGLPVELYIALDENHASVVPTVASRGLRYFFSKDA